MFSRTEIAPTRSWLRKQRDVVGVAYEPDSFTFQPTIQWTEVEVKEEWAEGPTLGNSLSTAPVSSVTSAWCPDKPGDHVSYRRVRNNCSDSRHESIVVYVIEGRFQILADHVRVTLL